MANPECKVISISQFDLFEQFVKSVNVSQFNNSDYSNIETKIQPIINKIMQHEHEWKFNITGENLTKVVNLFSTLQNTSFLNDVNYYYMKLLMTYLTETDPLYILLPVTFIYAIIFIAGIIGNVLTFLVIARNKSLHTPSNYYLFNMAISDLVFLFTGVENQVYYVWTGHDIEIKLLYKIGAAMFDTSINASVLSIMAITIERYMVICHPFCQKTTLELSRVKKVIVFIWVLSITSAILLLLLETGRISDVITWVLRFALPMLLITVLYTLIGIELRNKTNLRKSNNSYDRSNKKAIIILVTITVTFFICWAPLSTQMFYQAYYKPTNFQERYFEFVINDYLYYISVMLQLTAAAINPILYSVMSTKFQNCLKEMLNNCKITHFNSTKALCSNKPHTDEVPCTISSLTTLKSSLSK